MTLRHRSFPAVRIAFAAGSMLVVGLGIVPRVAVAQNDTDDVPAAKAPAKTQPPDATKADPKKDPEAAAAKVPPKPTAPPRDWPSDRVVFEIVEGLPKKDWQFEAGPARETFDEPYFALADLPHKYDAHGVRADRSDVFLVRAGAVVDLPAGTLKFVLRSRCGARLFVDGKLVATGPFPKPRGNGHNELYPLDVRPVPGARVLQPGDVQTTATFESEGGAHVVQLELVVGGPKMRPVVGETALCLLRADGSACDVLGPQSRVPLTDAGWDAFESQQRARFAQLDATNRRLASREYDAFWTRRHEVANKLLESVPAPVVPAPSRGMPDFGAIDRFVGKRLGDAGEQPTALVDDAAFLRRVSLDLIGTLPPDDVRREFLADRRPGNRDRLVDKLLAHPGWADHWTGYWQDVLAENPNIVNPTLNNTGPFRWWLHEVFEDNLPFDRFATELVLMPGSRLFGGPGGFELATENDAPFAAKANIVAQALLGADLRCARCHDAPFHPHTQRDLFRLAGLLARKPQAVPKSSTIPGGLSNSALVKVTLKPGESVPAEWPFASMSSAAPDPATIVSADDPRAQLAARLTDPRNVRFARSIVNRVWQRYLGRGLAEPVDDLDRAEVSDPALLDWLARDFVAHGYDLKHLARRIVASHLYQRSTVTEETAARAGLFRGPVRRKMTAEQLVDSLFAASGKGLHSEELNIDVDSTRAADKSLDLGRPKRAWEFTSLSNERDRPSLSLPAAQTFVALLEAFGWRGSRQDPVSVRPDETTVLQPALLANGPAAKRAAQLSEDSALTALALADGPPERFVQGVFERVLTRAPTPEESRLFVGLLEPGWSTRRTGSPRGPVPGEPARDGVCWSNHLKPAANEIRTAWSRLVEQGDPPTPRLDPDWRERAEDMIWALVNSPEFVFVP